MSCSNRLREPGIARPINPPPLFHPRSGMLPSNLRWFPRVWSQRIPLDSPQLTDVARISVFRKRDAGVTIEQFTEQTGDWLNFPRWAGPAPGYGRVDGLIEAHG